MSNDPFEEFLDAAEQDSEDSVLGGEERDLLVLEYAGDLFAVPASIVEAVVPWQRPAPLPRSTPGLAGVVQDRGRIVTVVNDPRGRSAPLSVEPSRLVVCATRRGHLGLPAERTLTVGQVTLAPGSQTGALVDSSEGPLNLVDVEAIVARLIGVGL